MTDLIDRQAAIDLLMENVKAHSCDPCPDLLHWTGIKAMLENLPSVQPEADEWCTGCKEYSHERHCCPRFNKVIREALSEARESQAVQRWIPFEIREPTEEEKHDNPEWEYVLCGKVPDDGQRILVNVKYRGSEAVQMDEYYDNGGESCLDSGYDIGTEATAWMPLPEPYREEEQC